MKCFVENFLELDIDGLLAVNGGYGSSSKSYGATSSSGSGNQTSWEVWDANKDGRNSSGEITRPHDPYRDTPNNSGTYKSTSSGTIGSSDNSKLRDLFFDKDYIADLLKQQGFEDSLGGNKSGDASVEKENTEEYTEYSGDVTTQEPTDNSIIGDSVNDFADTDNENSESTGLDVSTASQEDTQSTLPSCEDTVDVTENEDSVLGAPTDSRRVTGGGEKEDEVTPSTFEQRDFSDEYGENFGNNACAATSLLNEISEEYTEQTGEQLTKEQAVDAMSAAVEGGYIDSNDAFVKDWEGAADEMWESTGQDGDFVYNESEDADHVIYAQDTKGGPEVDHFVNSSGPDQYYDPWTGETCDLDPTVLQKDRPVRGFDFVE